MSKAAFFDVDGTLVDSVDAHAEAWGAALKAVGVEAPFMDVRGQIGKGSDQLLPAYLKGEALHRLGKTVDTHQKQIFAERFRQEIEPFPDVRRLLQALKAADVTVLLASSGGRGDMEHYMAKAEIEDLVADLVTGEDVARSKPFPDLFKTALDRVRPLTPEDCIAVGDTPYDAEAAGAAGLRTIGLLSGGFAESVLRAAGCIEIYRDPADLLARLQGSALLKTRP
jgi:HAD superfamily hydrolase (TIGR01509 family)